MSTSFEMMDVNTSNNTKLSNTIISPTFTWCFLMPTIHVLSLLSNILCIIVFSSNTFIKKPIAIYFIGLLISDSITLFIGYIEMIDRESHMIDKSSWLCMFNENIIHKLTDFIYTFMGRFCVEWILYKVLWTRASTIALAILSIQRSRTFFSLSYRETRTFAFCACIFSLIMALTITFLEWVGFEYNKVNNSTIYIEIYQAITTKNSSKQFYSSCLSRNYNESITKYPCMVELFNMTLFSSLKNQNTCSPNITINEFHSFTKSLLSNRDSQTIEDAMNTLTNIISDENNLSNNSLLKQQMRLAKSPDFITRLFENRTCQIAIKYEFWLKAFNFLHSVSFSFNRHALAIFFGNAFPSFIVLLANLLSIKAIFFSKNVQYLKESRRKNRRKRHFQNDLRAFIVILFESFSIIMISWGVPIFLTMFHCHSLYVVNISLCPKIKDYLALFLFTDLFNSSTNSLLYSLSGKLFRRKFIYIFQCLLTCGRGTLWHRRQRRLPRFCSPLNRQISNNPSTAISSNNGKLESASVKYLCKERLVLSKSNSLQTTLIMPAEANESATTEEIRKEFSNPVNYDTMVNRTRLTDDALVEKDSSSDTDIEIPKKSKENQLRQNSQSIKVYLMGKMRSISSTGSQNSKKSTSQSPSIILTYNRSTHKSKRTLFKSPLLKRQRKTDLSLSTSSISGSSNYSSQRKSSSINHHSLSKLLSNKSVENQLALHKNDVESLTCL